jgi:hypothetical protein
MLQRISEMLFEMKLTKPGAMAQTCNPSYSGGRDGQLSPDQGKVLEIPF